MIFGNMSQEETYSFLPKALKECFEYADSHDLAGFEKGSHPIDGERLFVNIVEYETTSLKTGFGKPTGSIWIYIYSLTVRSRLI